MEKRKFWALLPAAGTRVTKLVATQNWGINDSEIQEKLLDIGQYAAIIHTVELEEENKSEYTLDIVNDEKNHIGTLKICLDNNTGTFSLMEQPAPAVAALYKSAVELLEAFNEPNESEFDVTGDGTIAGLEEWEAVQHK